MINADSGRRRYLALWFPFLPADRIRLQAPDRIAASPDAVAAFSASPYALVVRVKGALRLGSVDARAQTLGLYAGMTLADARARHPDLAIFPVDDDADRHWLDRMAHRCLTYAPLVTTSPPDGIIIDITGVDHLFGGERALTEQVAEAFTQAGMHFRLACAGTAQAALALARHARLPVVDERQAIASLPVIALGLDAGASTALRRAGLKQVGDIAVRPAAAIASRFGAQAVTALRQLMGDAQQPLTPLPVSARLIFDHRFAEPVAHQEMIARTFLTLLRAAAQTLEARGEGGRQFRLRLNRSDGEQHRLDIETGRATRDPALVLRLFDERIGALADPLDPGFGYDSLRLHVLRTEPLLASQPGFDGDEQASLATDQAIAELIDQLSTRLGAAHVHRLTPRDSHIPERAQLALPAISCRQPIRWPASTPGEPPLRPLFLFDPPQPVEVIAEVPDGPPHRFRWRHKLHEVRLYEGPERIAGEWWLRPGGEQSGQGELAGLTRDYYRIEDVLGRRYWLFRHGLYEETAAPRWYVHGLFA